MTIQNTMKIKLGTKMVNEFIKRKNWRIFLCVVVVGFFNLINCIKIIILPEYAIIRLGDNS